RGVPAEAAAIAHADLGEHHPRALARPQALSDGVAVIDAVEHLVCDAIEVDAAQLLAQELGGLLIDAGVAAGDDFPFARDDGEPPLAETRLHLVVAQDLAIELIVAGTAQTQDRVLRAQQHHGVDVAAGDVAPAAGGGDLAHLWLRRGLGEALRDHQAAVSLDVSHQNPPVCMRPRTAPKPTSSVAPARGAVGSISASRPARRMPVEPYSIGPVGDDAA